MVRLFVTVLFLCYIFCTLAQQQVPASNSQLATLFLNFFQQNPQFSQNNNPTQALQRILQEFSTNPNIINSQAITSVSNNREEHPNGISVGTNQNNANAASPSFEATNNQIIEPQDVQMKPLIPVTTIYTSISGSPTPISPISTAVPTTSTQHPFTTMSRMTTTTTTSTTTSRSPSPTAIQPNSGGISNTTYNLTLYYIMGLIILFIILFN